MTRIVLGLFGSFLLGATITAATDGSDWRRLGTALLFGGLVAFIVGLYGREVDRNRARTPEEWEADKARRL